MVKTQSEVDSMISIETPLSQDTNISEETPLIPRDIGIGAGAGTSAGTSAGAGDEKSQVNEGGSSNASDEGDNVVDFFDMEHELEKPWPATFERSISLLADPFMDYKFIENVTKSPKITPNLSKRRENANYQTPEISHGQDGFLRPNRQFKQEMNKVQSLDFAASDPNRRSVDARMYRLQLLEEAKRKQQGKKGAVDLEKGGKGGIGAGAGTLKKKKRKKIDAHGGGSSHDMASVGQCVFNMSNSLMGVGLLSLPFVFKSAGWIGGVFATLTFSATTWRTSLLLGREMNGDPRPLYVFQTKEDRDTRLRRTLTSFPDIAREAFGQTGNIILSFVLYFELFSCLSIFLVTLGDHMHSLFPQISVAMHMFHISFALAVPTALLRTPRLLSYLSAVGTVATASVVIAVMLSSIYSGDISEELAAEKDIEVEHTHIYWDVNGLPLAFGLIAYTFSGHALIPSIYSSMAQPQDYEKMIRNTYFMVSGSCIIVACSGYYMFGSMVDDQVTLSLEAYSGSENVTMKVITWLMILTAFSKFTLSAFPLALGIEELFAPCVPTDYIMEWVSSIIKLVLIVSSLSVAIFCPSFSFLCSLVGLICTMIVSVIFPAAAHLKLFYNHIPLWEKVIDWLFIIGGTAMAIAGTYNQLK